MDIALTILGRGVLILLALFSPLIVFGTIAQLFVLFCKGLDRVERWYNIRQREKADE